MKPFPIILSHQIPELAYWKEVTASSLQALVSHFLSIYNWEGFLFWIVFFCFFFKLVFWNLSFVFIYLFIIFPVLCHVAYAMYFHHYFSHHFIRFHICLPLQYLLLITTLSLTSRSVELITVWSTVLQTPYTLVTYKLEYTPCVLLILILIWTSHLILPIPNITWLSSFIQVFPSE